ncbi:MAG: restriction endonuclease subunit S [Paraclostridium sp.]
MNKTPKLRFKEFSGDWNKTALKQVTNSFEYGMNSASTEFDGENKYIRITDIDENTSKYINTNVVSPLGELEDKYLVKENDILFARTGASTGKSYLYNKNDGKLYFAGFLIRTNVNSDNNAKFMFLQTKTKAYDKWVKVMSMRSGQPGINSQEYASYSFNAPSKEEQDKIASFFSLIDDKISLQGEKLKMLKDYKSGMMQKIFSRELRFKDDDGRDYPEWEEKKLGDITDIGTGSNDLQDKVESGKYPFYVRSSNIERINSYTFDGEAILIPGDGNIGQIYHYINGKFAYHQRVYKISDFVDGVLGKYIYYYMSRFFLKEALKNSVKATVDSLRLPTLTGMNVLLPCIKEQEKIIQLLGNIETKVEKEQEKLDYLNEYKKGLLQQMFV